MFTPCNGHHAKQLGRKNSVVGLDTGVVSFLVGHGKESMSAKNQIILSVVLFFVGFGGFIVYTNIQENNKQEQLEQELVQQDEKAKHEAVAEIRAITQKHLDGCLDRANQLKTEKTAELPRGVPADVYFGNLEALDRIIASAKDDCKRIHDLNAPLPAELQ